MQKIRKVHLRSEGLYNIALKVKSKEYVQWVFNQSMQYRKCLLFTLSLRPQKLKITLIRTMVRDLISVPSHVQERLTISTLPSNQLPLINQIQELLLDINIKHIYFEHAFGARLQVNYPATALLRLSIRITYANIDSVWNGSSLHAKKG